MQFKVLTFTLTDTYTLEFIENVKLGVCFITKNTADEWTTKVLYQPNGTTDAKIFFDTANAPASETILIDQFVGVPFGKLDKLIFETDTEVVVYLTYIILPDYKPAIEEKQDTANNYLNLLLQSVNAIASLMGRGATETTIQQFKNAFNASVQDVINKLNVIKDNTAAPVVIEAALKDPQTGAMRCVLANVPTDLATNTKLNELNSALDNILQNVAKDSTLHTDLMSLKSVLQAIQLLSIDIKSILRDDTIQVDTAIDIQPILDKLNDIYNKISRHVIIDNNYLNVRVVFPVNVGIDWDNNPALDVDKIRVSVDNQLTDVARETTLYQLSQKVIKCDTDHIHVDNIEEGIPFVNQGNQPAKAVVDNEGKIIISEESNLAFDINQHPMSTALIKATNLVLNPNESYTFPIYQEKIRLVGVRINTYNKDTLIELLQQWPNIQPTPFFTYEVSTDNQNNYADFEYRPGGTRLMENYLGIRIKNLSSQQQTYHIYVEVVDDSI